MVLVDPRLLQQQQQQTMMMNSPHPVPDATTDALTRLDRGIREILDGRTDLPLREKAAAYNEVLEKYLTMSDEYRDAHRPYRPALRPTPRITAAEQGRQEDEETYNQLEREAIESVPLKLKPKAERLLTYLKREPDLAWTDRGELVVDGHVVTDSHLVDLINDVIRPKRTTSPNPVGWEPFMSVLKRINVPKELIGHAARRKWLMQSSSPSSPTSPATPSLRTTKRQQRQSPAVPLWRPY